MRRRFLVECILIALLLPPVLLWLSTQPGLWHANAQLYDRMLEVNPPSPSNDVLIIGIDERSIHALGRWPWPRAVHAELLNTLAPHAPRAVFLDLFLTEASREPASDTKLARAIQQVPTYLPLLRSTSSATEPDAVPGFIAPLPLLAEAARATGHVNVTPDADGVVRTLYLREGRPGQLQPYLGLAMVENTLPPDPPKPSAVPSKPPSGAWVQQDLLRVPFAGPSGTYQTVSYISVLRGEVPDVLLRDKYLLVGVTDTAGLGDQILVPNGGPDGTISGVEIHANVMDAIRHGRSVYTLNLSQHGLWITFAVVCALLLFMRSHRHALATAAILCVFCLGLSAGAMAAWTLWLPPAAPLLGIVLAYILWGWRRLAALSAFFQERVHALNAVQLRTYRPLPGTSRKILQSPDFQTRALDNAITQLLHAHAMEQHSQEQREELMRFLSHDLRSPQVSILSLLSLWENKTPGMDTRELVDGVRREAHRTLELAEGFVDMTTAESDDYQFAECLAGSIVLDAMDQVWPFATARGVQLESHLPAAEYVLRADAHLLTRAIVNLLNNAIRHSESGGRISVDLSLGKRTPSREVVLSVQDEGEGMTPEQLNTLLSALPGKRRRDASVIGLGLGLALVRVVVMRHEGWMHATSTQGSGSTFLLGLPLAESPLEEGMEAQEE